MPGPRNLWGSSRYGFGTDHVSRLYQCLPDELSSQVRLFADDTAVYLIGGAEDGKVLQNDLDRLSTWEDRWDMEFNPSKCQVVRVTTARNFINTVYTLHGQVLEDLTGSAVITQTCASWLCIGSRSFSLLLLC